ncbi:MAG: DNA-processing protein DprA [Candidatus Paceibacterota bacterium]|nr:MAG: DNA-processing protein DprA [Candidatus Paceibacterota bacterium]
MRTSGVTHIAITDARYPERLRHIPNPPRILYCRGNIALLASETCIGIVGSRMPTSYGKDVTHTIATALAHAGAVIVSGLALGIDGIAHRAALAAHAHTIAVIGSGVHESVLYPPSHRSLAREIIAAEGLILSEYEPGTPARDYMFPERNRIISGLSRGIIVTEANEKSGALITARCAAEQNRDVFAVPGSILSPRSAGPNRLIRDGATPIMGAEDVIHAYDDLFSIQPSRRARIQDDLQQRIVAELAAHGPQHIDHLTRALAVSSSELFVAITHLALAKHIIQSAPDTWRITS